MKKTMKEELAWYRTRAAQLREQVERLEEALDRHSDGTAQLQMAADALLCQVALVYGQPVEDEETGQVLGRRLTLPLYEAGELLARYQVRARKDPEKGEYVVGVVEAEAVQSSEGGM